MYAKAPYTVTQRGVHIHPTVTELIPTMLGELKPLASTGVTIKLASVEGLNDAGTVRAVMIHALIPKQERKKVGLDDGLIRLSVGIEHLQDLLDDLKRGLGR